MPSHAMLPRTKTIDTKSSSPLSHRNWIGHVSDNRSAAKQDKKALCRKYWPNWANGTTTWFIFFNFVKQAFRQIKKLLTLPLALHHRLDFTLTMYRWIISTEDSLYMTPRDKINRPTARIKTCLHDHTFAHENCHGNERHPLAVSSLKFPKLLIFSKRSLKWWYHAS